MTVSDNIKQILDKTFKSEKALQTAIKNNEIYKFEELNINQIHKTFQIEIDTKLFDTNAKKHLTKIQEQISSNFTNQITQNYLKTFFYPTNEQKTYEKRKNGIEIIKGLNTSKIETIKANLKKVEQLKSKINLLQSFFTLEEEIEEKFYAKYKIKIQVLSQKEFQENYTSFDEDSVFITNEDLMIDYPTYKPEDFEKIMIGNLIKNNKEKIENLVEIYEQTKGEKEEIESFAENFNTEIKINLDTSKLIETLNETRGDELKILTNKVINIDEEIKEINKQLKEKIESKSINLQGEELIKLLNSGNLQQIQDKLKEETFDFIKTKEQEIVKHFKENKLKVNFIFANSSYPIEYDEEVQKDLLKQTERMEKDLEYSEYENLSKFPLREIKKLYNYSYISDLAFGISNFIQKNKLSYSEISKEEYILNQGTNIYIDNASPIDYGLSIDKINQTKLNKEKISVLTGANSGGKTTLLEMFLQSQILTSLGFPINAKENSKVKFYDEIIYLKKFTGTQGSGAFEQTIRNLVEILDSTTSKLLLIDEFEAVTEPGAAAKILINFLTELNERNINAIAVSHLGLEIQEYLKEQKITSIRIDGISAKGLDENGNLVTTHQPVFYELGKSTPELILKRILQDEKFWKSKSKDAKEILEKMI